MKNIPHKTAAALVGWTRVRPATRDPWSYDHHDPAIRAAEREPVNRLVATADEALLRDMLRAGQAWSQKPSE